MERRALGAVTLSLALVVLMVGSGLLRGDEPGVPNALPQPVPPAVGSCVRTDVVGAATVIVAVTCGEPHDAEVSMAWPVGEEPTAVAGVAGIAYPLVPERGYESADTTLCRGWSAGYVGEAADLGIGSWKATTPRFSTTLLSTPPGARVGTGKWSTCIIRASLTTATYRGSVGGPGPGPGSGTTLRHPPAVYLPCLAPSPEAPAAVADLRYTSCAEPHRLEILAERPRLLIESPGQQHDDECLAVARRLIDVHDPTYGGQLSVAVVYPGWRTRQQLDPYADPYRSFLCVAEVAAEGPLLAGSVRGLGGQPLPLV